MIYRYEFGGEKKGWREKRRRYGGKRNEEMEGKGTKGWKDKKT